MNAIFLGLIIGSLALTGVVVADVFLTPSDTLTPNDLGTEYNYKFILSEGGTCDIHYLRPRLKYEMGRYPDQISLMYPIAVIGFFEPLTKPEEIALLNAMLNDQEMCNYPSGVTTELTAQIHPDKFENLFSTVVSATPIKPIYFVDSNATLTLFIREPLTTEQEDELKNKLCDMWTVVKK